MKEHLRTAVFVLAWSWALSGCEPVAGINHPTTLTVALDAGTCPDAGPVAVSVSGTALGNIEPGGTVSTDVEAGTSFIVATGREGYSWSQGANVLAGSTHRFTLTCLTVQLTLGVLPNCQDVEHNIAISIDGINYGVFAPGTAFTKELKAGHHDYTALSSDLRRWGPYDVDLLPGLTSEHLFAC